MNKLYKIILIISLIATLIFWTIVFIIIFKEHEQNRCNRIIQQEIEKQRNDFMCKDLCEKAYVEKCKILTNFGTDNIYGLGSISASLEKLKCSKFESIEPNGCQCSCSCSAVIEDFTI